MQIFYTCKHLAVMYKCMCRYLNEELCMYFLNANINKKDLWLDEIVILIFSLPNFAISGLNLRLGRIFKLRLS